MPIVSHFYGIIVKMFFYDNDKHHGEHIHVQYGDYEAIFDFDANILVGELPNKQRKLVEAWIIIHIEELKSLWRAINNNGGSSKLIHFARAGEKWNQLWNQDQWRSKR